MRKEVKMLLLTGGLVAAGLALSFFGTVLAVAGLEQTEMDLGGGQQSVTAALDSMQGNAGVFALIVRDGSTDNEMYAKIYDPSGSEITNVVINENQMQITFDVVEDGMYKATVENKLDKIVPITVAFGSSSGSLAKAITITGTAILLTGLFGMAATSIYVFKLKGKT